MACRRRRLSTRAAAGLAGRIILLFAAVLILILPVRTAQAATPPLVTITTRVVGTGPNPYSTKVGSATYTATGGGPGYHVVALNRATLALVFNNTYGVDFTSLQRMNNDVTGLGNTALVIITSIGPPSAIASAALGFLNNVAASLGGTGQGYIYCFGTFIAGTNTSPSAYSLIGIPASGAPATQASATCANPDSDGNIAGVLVQDTQTNYAFVYSKFVTIQTMTGPQADTIMIGNKAFEAPPLPAGTPGGFHLLVVKRTTLDRIATDPTVVLIHQSYATNSNDERFAASEAARMANDLSRLQNALSNGLAIFIIASLGSNPGVSFKSDEAARQIQTIITELGGSGLVVDHLFAGNKGFYSLIGIPNSGDPTLSPEVRSWATPQLSGNITAVMQQNNVGLFTPISSSAFPNNVTLDLSLYSTAYAAPSQFPVAPHGSDPICPTGAQQCAAYKWISFQIICGSNPACTNEDVRGDYTNLAQILNRGVLDSLTYPSQPTTQPPGFVFSQQAFNKVKNQLNIEFALVNDIRNFFAILTDATTGIAIEEQDDLNSAYASVQTDVQLPPSMSAPPFNILGLVRDGLIIGQIVAGGLQPELIPVFAVTTAAIYGVMQVNHSPKGASNNQVLATFGDLASQIGTQYVNAFANAAVLENLLLTDWIKMQTIGTKIENAQQGSAWFLSADVVANVASALAKASTVGFYQALMPAKYQIVTFDGVPFNNPSDYSYSFDCNPSFAVCCCSGSIYSPPSGAWLFNGGSLILMAISPSDGSYPSNALTSKLFCTMNLYSEDFFFSQRGWSAMAEALPQGWSDYQARGLCGEPNTSCGVPPSTLRKLRHGLPGAVLPQKLSAPLLPKATRLKNYCALRR